MVSRSFTRVPVHVEAHVQPQNGSAVVGRVRDVSLNGLSLESDTELAPGTRCAIRILLDTGNEPLPIHAIGTVARAGGGVLALRIDGVAPDDHEHLEKLVLYNAPDAAQVEREARSGSSDYPALDPAASL